MVLKRWEIWGRTDFLLVKEGLCEPGMEIKAIQTALKNGIWLWINTY
jgi:hypothetical protein